MEPNRYSPRWFDAFLRADAVAPENEIAFLRRVLGPATSGVVLDAGAGTGRHAVALAAAIEGHVVALDRDRAACARCRARADELPGERRHAVAAVVADAGALPLKAASCDAVLSLWQSFGYGDHAANAAVLAGFARVLRPRGRLVMDVYHRGGQRALPAERVLEREAHRVRERRRWEGTRLEVELRYEAVADGDASLSGEDRFRWEVYEPGELARLAEGAGLRMELACARFDEAVPAGPGDGRMQVVFSRPPRPRPTLTPSAPSTPPAPSPPAPA